jgi:hypothetical protein
MGHNKTRLGFAYITTSLREMTNDYFSATYDFAEELRAKVTRPYLDLCRLFFGEAATDFFSYLSTFTGDASSGLKFGGHLFFHTSNLGNLQMSNKTSLSTSFVSLIR